MPWVSRSPVNERMQFVLDWEKSPDENFSALCRRYGVSRRTGYKWLDRFEAGGPGALDDRPPMARAPRGRTPLEVVDKVLAARKAHPLWGARKVRAWLAEKEPELVLPAASTLGDLLKRYGLVRVRKRRLRVALNPNPLDPCAAPNDVWCADFKGHFALGDGQRCYPLTITDACSRYIIRCEGLVAQTEELVRRQFELAFMEFGLPRRIRTDNGAPFATLGPGALGRLSIWWMKLGIIHERIEPGHPEQNGRHERMHRTLKAHTANPPAENMAAQQRRFDLFRGEFNNERPHEALAQRPPARVYTTSPRAFPRNLVAPACAEGMETRSLDEDGKMGWKGKTVTIVRALGRETVGVEPVDANKARVFYGPVLLGHVECAAGKVVFTRSRLTADAQAAHCVRPGQAVTPTQQGNVSAPPDDVPPQPVNGSQEGGTDNPSHTW